ncbi:MAG TPA: PAS domain S-box protein, partial [Candidatus Binataceae bacterium]|nr:PAS domain S-box protein [Candidatus Binataceae bacterium]
IISWNVGAQRLIGFSRDEAIGQLAEIFIPPSDREFARVNMIADLTTMSEDPAATRRLEVQLLTSDGRVIDVSMVASAIRDRDGRLQGLSAIFRDISERKRAEREHALLAAIVESSDDAIVSLSLDMLITTWNRGAEKLFGFSAKEAIGRPIGIYIPPEVRQWEEQFLKELRTRLDRVNSFEVPCLRKDGSRVDTWTVCFGIRDKAGNLVGISAIHRDMTARKRSEHEQALLAASVKASADAIISLSLDGKITSWNPAAEKVYGFTAQEAIGQGVELFVPPDEVAQSQAGSRSVVETGEAVTFEQTARRRDGKSFTSLVNIFPILDSSGQTTGVAGIGRDITALKNTQRELVEAREAAMAASQAKSEFLSSMSHEIRTPMTAILGMAELLLESEMSPEQRRYLEILNNNGRALLDLINSILDLAKVESGRLSLEHTDFDLREVLEKTVETLATRAHNKGLELMTCVGADVPAGVVGDPLRLRQVLTNLVGNSIKFTDRGGEVLVRVDMDGAEGETVKLRFSVRDTGIGISPEQMQRLFSAFTQGDSSTARRYGGSGLGLTIVKRLVGLMQGEVSVDSQLGQGSTFSFTAQFDRSEKVDAAAPSRMARLDGCSILVADSNRTSRQVLRELLERQGATVIEAASAGDAIEQMNTSRPALTIVDDRLPETNQKGLAELIASAAKASRPVLAMIRCDDLAAGAARVRKFGITNYLVKPVKTSELGASVASALRPSANDSRPKVVPGSANSAAPVVKRALRILYADDSPDSRALVRAFLKRTPYRIDEVENGREAISAFSAGNYDAVLMDIQMPEVDGYAATRAIRQWEFDHQRPRTPVIALTASAFPDAVRSVLEAGCDMHVAKPVSKLVLLQAIYDAVQHEAPDSAAHAA